jgi:hypothetical protein
LRRRNGTLQQSQSYAGIITPQHGTAPVRVAIHDFFLGTIRGVRFWNRALTVLEVQMVFTNTIPQDGLVAEYLLEQDIAPDTTGLHDGQILWRVVDAVASIAYLLSANCQFSGCRK